MKNQQLDQPIFSILCDHGKDIGLSLVERSPDEWGLDATVDDILHGQVENVVAVFCWNPVEHTADDVTEDIARAVANKAYQGNHTPSRGVIDFIENNAGLAFTRQLLAAE